MMTDCPAVDCPAAQRCQICGNERHLARQYPEVDCTPRRTAIVGEEGIVSRVYASTNRHKGVVLFDKLKFLLVRREPMVTLSDLNISLGLGIGVVVGCCG